jgi:hypothetical protein
MDEYNKIIFKYRESIRNAIETACVDGVPMEILVATLEINKQNILNKFLRSMNEKEN